MSPPEKRILNLSYNRLIHHAQTYNKWLSYRHDVAQVSLDSCDAALHLDAYYRVSTTCPVWYTCPLVCHGYYPEHGNIKCTMPCAKILCARGRNLPSPIVWSKSVLLYNYSSVNLLKCHLWSHLSSISGADSSFVPSQTEKSLHSNTVSHWLGANLESALHFDGLVQDCSNSTANTLELMQSYPKPSI